MADIRRCEFEPGFFVASEFYYDSDWGWIHGHKPANGIGPPSGPATDVPPHNADGDLLTGKGQVQPRDRIGSMEKAIELVERAKEQVIPRVEQKA